MKSNLLKLSCGSLLFFCMGVQSENIGLVDDKIDAAIIRTIETPSYGVGRICCYGLDNTFVVKNGSEDQKQYSSAFLLNVDSYSFILNYIGLSSWQEGIVLSLSDLDFSEGNELLTGVSISTDVEGLTWEAGSNYVNVNLGGTTFNPESYIAGTFNVTPKSVPELSSSLAPISILLLSALLCLGIERRRTGIASL